MKRKSKFRNKKIQSSNWGKKIEENIKIRDNKLEESSKLRDQKIEESNKLRDQKIKIAQLTKRPVNEKEQQIQTPENEECKKQTNKDKWNSNKTSTSIILFCFSFYFRSASLNRQDSFLPHVNICLLSSGESNGYF